MLVWPAHLRKATPAHEGPGDPATNPQRPPRLAGVLPRGPISSSLAPSKGVHLPTPTPSPLLQLTHLAPTTPLSEVDGARPHSPNPHADRHLRQGHRPLAAASRDSSGAVHPSLAITCLCAPVSHHPHQGCQVHTAPPTHVPPPQPDPNPPCCASQAGPLPLAMCPSNRSQQDSGRRDSNHCMGSAQTPPTRDRLTLPVAMARSGGAESAGL